MLNITFPLRIRNSAYAIDKNFLLKKSRYGRIGSFHACCFLFYDLLCDAVHVGHIDSAVTVDIGIRESLGVTVPPRSEIMSPSERVALTR